MDAIRTPRLILRPLQRTDLRALHALYADAELMRYVTGYARTPKQTAARLRKDLGHHRDFGFGLCLALWAADGRPVGRCGLEPVPGPDGVEGEAAWMFARPWWGKGLATEAGRALLDFGLGELGLHRVFAEAHHRNEASLSVMRKLGMRYVGEKGDGRIYEVRASDTPNTRVSRSSPGNVPSSR
jgi:ribosomal-protein-alanine N-acetyltransferase